MIIIRKNPELAKERLRKKILAHHTFDNVLDVLGYGCEKHDFTQQELDELATLEAYVTDDADMQSPFAKLILDIASVSPKFSSCFVEVPLVPKKEVYVRPANIDDVIIDYSVSDRYGEQMRPVYREILNCSGLR